MVLNAYNFWVPLFGLAGIGVVAPVWLFFLETRMSSLPTHIQFFAALPLPLLAALLVASWIDPG